MDLPEFGSHCSLTSCNELDFLPIHCLCDRYFCRHHISADAHSCPVELASDNSTKVSLPKLQRCAVDNCRKPSLESSIMRNSNEEGRSPATCSHCQKPFCADHRHPKSHACPVQDITPQQKKNEAARALLAKNFPLSSKNPAQTQPRTSKIPTDSAKLAQHHKFELMKMRHRAVPADPNDKASSIPLHQRLHIKVQGDNSTEKLLWFRKTIVTGKALDQIASQLGMFASDTSPLQLLKLSINDPNERLPLRNDQPLTSQVKEGSTLALAHLMRGNP